MADPYYGFLLHNPLQGTPWTVNMGAQAASNAANAGNNNWWSSLLGADGMKTAGGILGGLGQIGGLATGIMQGLAGFQQMGLANKAYNLAKQQFGFQKALANRNLENSALAYNNALLTAARTGAGMVGYKDANGRYGGTDKAVEDAWVNDAKKRFVNGSALG